MFFYRDAPGTNLAEYLANLKAGSPVREDTGYYSYTCLDMCATFSYLRFKINN
jgi:hypothetical protein